MPVDRTRTVLDRITDDVIATLEGVRMVADYSLDLHVEKPNNTTGNRTQDGGCVVVVGSPERVTEGCPQPLTEWHQSYEIIVTRIRPEANTTHIDEYLSRALADVTRAMTADINRGGLAHETWIESPSIEYVGAEANAGVLTVRISVIYRTYFNDPHRCANEV